MKKSKLAKFYSAIVALVVFFAMTTVAFGAVVWNGFSYYSYSPGYQYLTEPVIKSDASSAVASYDDGSASTLYVQIQGSQNSENGYTNQTITAGSNGEYVAYVKVPLGSQQMITNLVYEQYNSSAFARLMVYVYTQGTVTGEWSPTT